MAAQVLCVGYDDGGRTWIMRATHNYIMLYNHII